MRRFQLTILILFVLCVLLPSVSIAQNSFTGTWLFRGIAGQNCTIAGEGNGLRIVTEKGVETNKMVKTILFIKEILLIGRPQQQSECHCQD